MPKLIIPGGETLDAADVEKQFAAAMAAPEPDEPMAPAPERKDTAPAPEPAAAAAPEDKPSHNKARTTTAAPAGGRGKGRRGGRKAAAEPATSVPAEGAYVRPVAEFLEGAVIGAALLPFPDGDLRTKVRLQAAIVNEHTVGIATAVDAAARHNATIRRGVEALTQGAAGWVLPAVMAIAPFVSQSLAMWRSEVGEEMVQTAKTFESSVKAHIQQTAMGPAAGASPTA